DEIVMLERVPPQPATNVWAAAGARQAAIFWDAPAPLDSPSQAALEYAVSMVGDPSNVCVTTDTSCVLTDLPAGPAQFVVTTVTDAGSVDSEPSEPVMITEPVAPTEPPAATEGTSIVFAGDTPDAAMLGDEVEIVVTG